MFNSPEEVCRLVIKAGEKKANLPFFKMALLGILAGAYIGFGAELSTVISHDLGKFLGVGIEKFIAGSVFSLGLILVVLGGAELFTGDCLIIQSYLDRRIRLKYLLKIWVIVYLANFIGSLILAKIYVSSGLYGLNSAGVGLKAISIASGKLSLTFLEAFWRGVLCNWLVCLAIWLAFSSKDVTGKILGIYFPIMAFVASGFEHSIANMYFIPLGIFLKHPLSASISSEIFSSLRWSSFLWNNLLPVTLGNIVGGAFFVGVIYWIVYRS